MQLEQNGITDIYEILSHAPLFSGIDGETLQQLAGQSMSKQYARNEFIFHSGELPGYLHVLADGCIQLSIGTTSGRETVLELIQPLETFVLAPALTAQPYLMSAHAVEPSVVIQIPVQHLLALLHNNSELALALIASMAKQYRYLVREIKGLRLRTAAQRLGLYLLHLSRKNSPQQLTRLPYEKKLLAGRLGMTPESFSRAISELRRHGAEIHGDTLHITNMENLQRFCGLDQVLDILESSLQVILPDSTET